MTDDTSTPTLADRLNAFVEVIATDVNALVNANNSDFTNVAASLKQLQAELAGVINDATATSTTTWSAAHIAAFVEERIAAAFAAHPTAFTSPDLSAAYTTARSVTPAPVA